MLETFLGCLVEENMAGVVILRRGRRDYNKSTFSCFAVLFFIVFTFSTHENEMHCVMHD